MQIRLNTFRPREGGEGKGLHCGGIHSRAILCFSSAVEIGGSDVELTGRTGISPETDGKRDATDGGKREGAK